MTTKRYVLVTAAYNEEGHVADTLRSVVGQRALPHRWVIVSDGSTDRTDEIVVEWAKRHPLIRFVRVDRSAQHSFSAKVHALRKGIGLLDGLEYDFIGVVDADVAFEPDYFERLIDRFANETKLGIAGGNIEQHVDGVVIPRSKTSTRLLVPYSCFAKNASSKPAAFLHCGTAARTLRWKSLLACTVGRRGLSPI